MTSVTIKAIAKCRTRRSGSEKVALINSRCGSIIRGFRGGRHLHVSVSLISGERKSMFRTTRHTPYVPFAKDAAGLKSICLTR